MIFESETRLYVSYIPELQTHEKKVFNFFKWRGFYNSNFFMANNDTTKNFFTILTVWTKIVHTVSGEDNHCPHCYQCGQNVKNVEKNCIFLQCILDTALDLTAAALLDAN